MDESRVAASNTGASGTSIGSDGSDNAA